VKTSTKTLAALASLLALSACGGGGSGGPAVTRAYATGPMQTACLRADRTAASPQLCGCVQAAADAVLSSRDQSRAVRFFRDPGEAQEVRQSDRRGDEAFWQRYRTFVDVAERTCS
jgi:hypothetical protein